MHTFAMPSLSRRPSDDPSGRARQPVTAISCDPAAAPDVSLITLWRGRDYRVYEHLGVSARVVANELKTLWSRHRLDAVHVNSAGAGRAVVDQLKHDGVPVCPWQPRPSDSASHHGADALRYAFTALQLPDRARAYATLRESLNAIASAITQPVKTPAAPAAPAPRALCDSPWFFVACAILGMLAGTVISTTAYFFHHP